MSEIEHGLGKWAVIDIETTGIDPLYDDIIDVGFLQFEGAKLVRTYRSLIRSEQVPSFFIQKLTGITEKMLRKAPMWSDVEPEVMDLFGHHLLAHNADFERSFLAEHFDRIDDGTDREVYEDSMPFLALLFPNRSSLKLESFIVDWGLAEGEVHRGYEDSLDLLKVLLIAVRMTRQDKELKGVLNNLFAKYNLKNYWYSSFFNLYDDELEELAEQIDFELDEAVARAREFEFSVTEKKEYPSERDFSIEFSGENIKTIFRSEDKIKARMPGYRYRSSQEEMSLRVGQSFKNGVHALVQAPTGTGKTMGYLIPSALFALEEQRQVLVATGTKTLQHQAMTKDVPILRELLGLSEDQLKIKRSVQLRDVESGPDQSGNPDDIRSPSTIVPDVVAPANTGCSGADCHTRVVIHEQRALAVEFQMVSDKPPELGMKGDELHIAFGLAVSGCPRMPPAASQSTSPVA